ncbi:MAG: hypothetical protein M3Z83_04665 [Actinomycetota bacterium]|nr:hypothetical protein [Actinomycetota bacterium]
MPARRRRPALSTTVGSALGLLVVSTVLDASWWVRAALVLGALIAGLGYLAWRRRAEIDDTGPQADPTSSEPSDHPISTDHPIPTDDPTPTDGSPRGNGAPEDSQTPGENHP